MNAWNNNQDLYNVINHVMMTTMITLMDMYQQTQRTHKTNYNGNKNKNNYYYYKLCFQNISYFFLPPPTDVLSTLLLSFLLHLTITTTT